MFYSLELKTEKVKNSNFRLSLAKKQFENNTIDKMTYLEANVNHNQMIIDKKVEMNNYKITKEKLKNMLDLNEFKNFTYTLGNHYESFDENIFKKNIKELLKNNIQYKMSLINIKLSKNEVLNSKYEYYPKIDLNLSYTNYDPNDNFATDYQNVSTASLNVKIPIFSGGSTNASVKKNKFILKSYEEELTKNIKNIENEFRQSLIKLKSFKENFYLYKESIESAELYFKAIHEAYKKGLKSIIDLSDAKVKLNETKYEFYNNYYSYLFEYSTLMYILGELNPELIDKLEKKI